MGVSFSEFDTMLQHIKDGADPFKTWMLANGYSEEIIDQIYQIIDQWLIQTKLSFPKHPPDPTLN
jgi:hypothetical protein